MLLFTLFGCAHPDTSSTEINDAIASAAEQYGVPQELLAAIAWTGTRLNDRGGSANTEGAVGIMNLHADGTMPSAVDAADAIGVDPAQIGDHDADSINGAAALMAKHADEYLALTGNRVDTWQEWYAVTAWYSGASDPLIADGYADQVYDWLQFGLVGEAPSGELVEITPISMPWRRLATTGSGLVDQFVAASSANYSDYNRGVGDITQVVIHTTEGSYAGTISWFQNASAQSSAHYVIRSSDGQITQMIQEEDVAWHAGDWNTNLHSIGIEHEGYVADPTTWYTDAMYTQSAALTKDICTRYSIPIDRSHIIGHYEVPGCSTGHGGGSSCHTDPGDGWDWDKYMALVSGSTTSSSPFPDGTSGSGSASTDGTRHGTFSASVSSSTYGETDTCAGDISGAVNNGQLYLTGTCTLVNHPDKSGDLPVTWSGTIASGVIAGRMTVDGHSADFTGSEADDGSVSARFSGSEEIGGDVGNIDYEVAIDASL